MCCQPSIAPLVRSPALEGMGEALAGGAVAVAA